MAKISKSLFNGLAFLFMPPLCQHCGKDRWGDTPLCLTCLKLAKPLRQPVCQHCGLPECNESHSEPDSEPVSEKQEIPSRFLFRISPQISTLVHGLKYRHLRRNIRFLSAYLRYRPDIVAWSQTYDFLTPVPIHAVRKRERGYNQAEEIAKDAAEYLGKAVLPKVLGRVRATVSQTTLNRNERGRNLENAFVCVQPGSVVGKRILLVDDVYTTGATAGQCAALLIQAGALSVGVLALAKVESAMDLDDFSLEMEIVSSYAT